MDASEAAVTAEDIACMLCVSTDKVLRLARSGEIPAFKVGRLWRFWPSKVRQSLETPRDPWARSPRSRAKANRRAA